MNASDGTNDQKRPDDQQPTWGPVPWQSPAETPAASGDAPDGHHFAGSFGAGSFGAGAFDGQPTGAPAADADAAPAPAAHDPFAPGAPAADSAPAPGTPAWQQPDADATAAFDRGDWQQPEAHPTTPFEGANWQQPGEHPTTPFEGAHQRQPDEHPTAPFGGWGEAPQAGAPGSADGYSPATGAVPKPGEPAPAPFGAPPMALPGDQSSPFGAHIPGGPEQHGEPLATPAPKPKKKRRGLIIGASIAAALIAAAAIITPIVIHNNNVAKGDELAADFQAGLDAYNATWSAERIGALDDVKLSEAIPNGEFYLLSDAQLATVQSTCESLGGATTARDELAGASVPELVVDEAATASEAYVAAQGQAAALGEQRTDAEALLEETGTAYADIQQYCDRIGGYTDAVKKLRENEAGVYKDSFVVENGGRFESSDGSVYWVCEAETGCPNLYDSTTRTQYADAYATTYVEFAKSMVTLYTDQCIMDRYADACAVGATEWQKSVDANQALVDHLKTTEPKVAVGEALYPTLGDLFNKSTAADTDAANAVTTKMREIDSTSSGSTGSVIAGHFRDQEARIATLIENASK